MNFWKKWYRLCRVSGKTVVIPYDMFEFHSSNGDTPLCRTSCAADSQIAGSCWLADTTVLLRQLKSCAIDAATSMSSNHLQVNAVETEVIWVSSSRCHHEVPDDQVHIDSYVNWASETCQKHVDMMMSLQHNVIQLTTSCFGFLRQIHIIRRCHSSQACIM